MEKILTLEEVAAILKLDIEQTRILLRKEELKGFKVGKFWRVKESELEKYINR